MHENSGRCWRHTGRLEPRRNLGAWHLKVKLRRYKRFFLAKVSFFFFCGESGSLENMNQRHPQFIYYTLVGASSIFKLSETTESSGSHGPGCPVSHTAYSIMLPYSRLQLHTATRITREGKGT